MRTAGTAPQLPLADPGSPGWGEVPQRAFADVRRLSLECSTCGYGIVQPGPPDRCPMCQRRGSWVHSRPRAVGDPSA